MDYCPYCSHEIENAKDKRTLLQNRALHKLFSNVADQLNYAGETYDTEIQGIKIQMRYTMIIFKEEFWKPIQKSMYGIESTTQLNTKKINDVLDVLTLAFATKGIGVEFPSYQYYLDQLDSLK